MRAGIRMIRLYKAVALREGAGPHDCRARARYQASLVLGARYRPGASFCPRSCACAQDDSIICRDDNRLGGCPSLSRRDLATLIAHAISNRHLASSSNLPLLSRCHPCEGEDLRTVGRAEHITLPRFMEPDIGRSFHSARGPRLRQEDSIIHRFYNRLGGGIVPSGWCAVRALRRFASRGHAAASSFPLASSSYPPLLSNCHPCEGEDLRTVERGGDIGLPRFRERYIGRSLRSARGPRLRKDDSFDICGNRLGGRVTTASGLRRASR